MRPTYDSDTATFRQTIRDFLDANLPADCERIRSLAVAGVDAVRLGPIGRTRAEQRTHLEMAIDLVRSATAPAE